METPRLSPSDEVGLILVDHPQYLRVVEAIEFAIHQYDAGQRRLPCVPIYGHPGAGKSTVVRFVEAANPRVKDGVVRDNPDGTTTIADYVPVLWVDMPTKVNVTNLAREILRGLGDTAYDKGAANLVPDRVDRLLRHCGTKAILIDEGQRVVDRAGVLTAEGVIDWLKERHGRHRIGFFMLGLPRMRKLFDQDGQFYRRWDTGMVIKPYAWDPLGNDTQQRYEFMGLLAAFQTDSPIPFAEEVDVALEEVAQRFHYASRGLAGGLYKLLEAAARILEEDAYLAARDPERPQRAPLVDFALLHDAFDKAFEQEREVEILVNPFGPDFDGRSPPRIPDENYATSLAKRKRTLAKKRGRRGPTRAEIRADLDAALSKA